MVFTGGIGENAALQIGTRFVGAAEDLLNSEVRFHRGYTLEAGLVVWL